MSTLNRMERGTLRTALGLLLAIGIVPIALGANARPDGTTYTPSAQGRAISVTLTSNVADLLGCLLGPNVTVTGSSLSAAAVAAGTFSGALNVIGFDQGIVLSSGDARTLIGPNLYDNATQDNQGPGDTDLDALVPGFYTHDAAVLTIHFTCQTASVISFQYVFGSEEYNEYVNSGYNDVFGFFLNGVNIAAVPGGCSNPGIPVAINNVNCGNPYGSLGPNCNCYRNNDLTDGGGLIDTELDGLTQVFVATGLIQPGANTIKIAIADVQDYAWDSDVMIRCQSFNCGATLPTGACCFPSGLCVTLTYPDCSAQSGNYYGDVIPCLPNPCAQPTGACCFPTGECEMTGQAGCLANGGTYHGDSVPCSTVACPQPSGACCSRNAFCRILPRARCEALRGIFVAGPCTPSVNPPCRVQGVSKSGDPQFDDGAPMEKGSWGQIKNHYR